MIHLKTQITHSRCKAQNDNIIVVFRLNTELTMARKMPKHIVKTSLV